MSISSLYHAQCQCETAWSGLQTSMYIAHVCTIASAAVLHTHSSPDLHAARGLRV